MRIFGLLHVIKWLIVGIAVLAGINYDGKFFVFLVVPVALEFATIAAMLLSNVTVDDAF